MARVETQNVAQDDAGTAVLWQVLGPIGVEVGISERAQGARPHQHVPRVRASRLRTFPFVRSRPPDRTPVDTGNGRHGT
jgi:hypothetical protein